jgi:phosphomannomutase
MKQGGTSMAAKFGTSGLRGLVGELTDGTAAAHARAFARHLKQTGMAKGGDAIFLGLDMRASSPEIAAQCAAAVQAEALVPVDCGVVSTPALALYAMRRQTAALMITGSHIPDDRNGVKFYRPDGEIDKGDEEAIAALAPSCTGLEYPSGAAMRNLHEEVLDEFVARYRDFASGLGLAGLRIGLYEHSSAASIPLVRILQEAGAEVVRLGPSDHFIPVDTEAVSDETRALVSGWVRNERLDGLVSADGDGDRPLVVDETGTVLRGDALGLIVARHLQADAVVTPVTSNSGIERRCDAQVRRTRVGSPFVIAGMQAALKTGSRRIVGFEANGGVLTGNEMQLGPATLAALPTRDSVLPILCALGAARSAGQSLSAHVAELALPVAASDRIENFPTEQSQKLVTRLSGNSEECARFFAALGEVRHTDLTDGLRVTLDDRRVVHLRPSGNAPEMRVYAEAADETTAKALIVGTIERIGQDQG